MLVRPKKRSCPSCIASNFWNMRRQPPGERKGNRPSSTSIKASAAQNRSLLKPRRPYFFAGAAAPPELPRNALKNSEPDGSTTITSLFLLKLAL